MKRILLLAAIFASLPCVAQKSMYLEEIKKAAEKGWRDNPAIMARWRSDTQPNVLWGYNAPGHPIYLAATLAFLYQETGERTYAERTASLLASYGDLRESLPKGFAATRVEYENGVPSLSNFFYFPPYVRAYLIIRGSGVLNEQQRKKIEGELAQSVDFLFRFPEWGAHNRAMLRAEALSYARQAMPHHPSAPRWQEMEETIARDNVGHWEIEDASGYHPVWLHALFSWADAAGHPEVFTSPITQYYYQYYLSLIGPNGTIPDFGDATWNSSASGMRFVAFFEKGAAVTGDPRLRWAAASVFRTRKAGQDTLGVGDAYHLCDAYRWTDESVVPQQPSSLSQEALEDLVGKKIVFRNGWDAHSTYLLLNYRDEGEGGWLDRRYLRNTISVEEEKMTHGHADENSIVLLMDGGSVFLHDAGYRDGLPSGAFGSWRQDYFHNRLVARKDKRDPHQGLLEFLRNSGAYRPVTTLKVDFLPLREVDMSRTRMVDENLGYQWDRIITYVRDPGWFVVVDAVKMLRTDYFTFSTLWHAQHVLSSGEHFYDVATDSISGEALPSNRSLLVAFPETYAKSDGTEPIHRHSQDETMVYQTQSSHYHAGDTEVFVTVLMPHDRGEDLAPLLSSIELLQTSRPYRAVGLRLKRPQGISTLGIVVDLDMEIARENVRPRYLYELGAVRYGEWETDAHFFFATESGGMARYSAANVLKVRHGGVTAMEALPNTHSLQLDGGPDNHVGFSKWRAWEDSVSIGKGTH
jgi:hypothetical protein